MFFFAFHTCGLRVVDVMTLQWKHLDFARNELRKVMIKSKRLRDSISCGKMKRFKALSKVLCKRGIRASEMSSVFYYF